MFRGSSTQLYVPAFTQKDFHELVHKGLPHREPPLRIWGKYNREYTTPLSTEYNLSLEARHKATQINLTNEG